MTTRTIQAPGIEVHEIDRSEYNTDYSIVGTTSFIAGFADKGEDYTTQWVNTRSTLEKKYGTPKNEPEMYFYNAAMEILNKGGVCLMSKLPYDNASKDKFTFTTYTIDSLPVTLSSSSISSLLKLDSSLTSFIKINSIDVNQHPTQATKMHLSALDALKVRSTALPKNTIKIVDITRGRYDILQNDCVQTSSSTFPPIYTNECLGIVPIIVSPANAIYFQNMANAVIDPIEVSAFNNINSYQTVYANDDSLSVRIQQDFTEIVKNWMSMRLDSQFHVSDDYLPTESWSKTTSELFPQVISMSDKHFDTQYLKSIGVVVLQAFADTANQNYLNFKVLESFVGSLDKNAKDPVTGGTTFIDTIINSQSKYINFFSSIDKNLLKQGKIINITNQTATSLGFYEIDLQKKISYTESIAKPLTTIFKANSNPNTSSIDLVVDAGVTTIAQLVSNCANTSTPLTIDFTYDTYIRDYDWKWNERKSTSIWNTVTKIYDNFCKSTRRDCMFLADAPRIFCIDGDSKRVRSTDLNSSIDKDIIPKLPFLTGINSSYGAGYCDWFYQQDASSGDFFWCPPSIKAAGIYTYTDAYFHKWDAPAGLTRGVVKNVVDCAFSPTNEEAGKIYSQSWNYAISYPLNGIVLEGQRTFQIKKTAFDRVNVRRLFLYLEKLVVRIAKRFLYEGNTPFLRQRFVDTINPIFKDAVNGQGILDFYIKCDDTNNPPEVVDRNELRCTIAVKPVKSIEFIVLNFICTSQNASVTEAVAE